MPQPKTSANLLFDRTLVRRRRDRAALSFSQFDFLLRRCEEDFAQRLEAVSPERKAKGFGRVLNLGCHDGSGLRILKALKEDPWSEKPIDLFVACDLSDSFARRHLAQAPRSPALVVDEEWLPFAEESFDLILAPLTLHFVNDLPGALVQLRRCLRPGGLLLTCLFGGETLSELRTVLSQAEIDIEGGLSPRVIPFTDVKDLGALLQRVGFSEPVTDVDRVTVTYPDLRHLIRDLKGMGLANPMIERRKTPMKAATLEAASVSYSELFREDGEISASFHILFGTSWAAKDPLGDQ
jgi:NADH dehydrogenase [ubiquinone] 1 alpha subcomplex assembly factor 5